MLVAASQLFGEHRARHQVRPGCGQRHHLSQFRARRRSRPPRRGRSAPRTPPSRHFSRSLANSREESCSPPSSSNMVRLFSAAAGARSPVSKSGIFLRPGRASCSARPARPRLARYARAMMCSNMTPSFTFGAAAPARLHPASPTIVMQEAPGGAAGAASVRARSTEQDVNLPLQPAAVAERPHALEVVEAAHFKEQDGRSRRPNRSAPSVRQALDADVAARFLLDALRQLVGDRRHMTRRPAAGDHPDHRWRCCPCRQADGDGFLGLDPCRAGGGSARGVLPRCRPKT